MDTRTGEILPMQDVLKKPIDERKWYKEMDIPLTPQQIRTHKVGRNDPCPCNSGKKFKKCCLNQKSIPS